jgi:hypothetical protein
MAKTKKIKKNAVVLTSRDLLNGYVANNSDFNLYNMSPLQMVPSKEKDEDWKKWNLDWLERAGIRQLSNTSKRLIKNYHLANGILDKSDYIVGPENDMSDMISLIVKENENTLPIRFYPIIPNIINVLVGEFSKRDMRMIAKAVDELSKTEAYEYKMQLLTDILVKNAMAKKDQQLRQMDIYPESEDPQVQQTYAQEQEAAKAMAEAEVKFKNYRGIAEQWANHILQLDTERFNMYEKEIDGFRDMLICDREFWHVRVKEDDYDVELWNPVNTFYHKSPNVYYISEANYVGRIQVMSIPDVVDLFGHQMTEEQLLTLKNHYRTLNSFPLVTDAIKDQENWYTNFSQPYPKNYTNVTWQKYLDGQVGKTLSNHEGAFSWYDMSKAGNTIDFDVNGPGMVRVTEAYWKSQKRVGHLTKISRDGTLIQDIVDEDYVVTEEPIYNKSLLKIETKENLVSGEHIDWIWINEVRWGVKFNSSLSTYYSRNYSDFEPIYLGGDPIPFQFKGQNNLYGCKLPVEGKIFTERNTFSSSTVDKMKANQVNYNIVNNQIVEMLADEIGNVIVLDQNMVPRNSLKGQWGPYNFPMFHQVMKDYQIAAIDPSIRNTENATNFSHFQQVDMSKTNQIMTRLELARHFKDEAFSVVGITPQRLGNVSASESATGTQQAVNNSYAQTEPLFDQHMNHLMPRVRQMMLEAAQFITSRSPMASINYLNSNEENVLFQIEGWKLLLRDLRIYSKSTANVKELLNQLKQLAIQNNTAGGTLFELAETLTSQSPSEIISKLREAEDKRNQMIQAQQQHELELQQAEAQALAEREAKQQEHDDYWKEREIEKDIKIAQIRALGFPDANDIDANSVPDVLEVDKFLYQQGVDANDQMLEGKKLDAKNQENARKAKEHEDKMKLEEKKLASKEKIEKIKLRNKVVGEK